MVGLPFCWGALDPPGPPQDMNHLLPKTALAVLLNMDSCLGGGEPPQQEGKPTNVLKTQCIKNTMY